MEPGENCHPQAPLSQGHVLYDPPEARGELEEEALEVMLATEAEEGLGQVLPGLGEGDFLAGLLFRDSSQILLFSNPHEKRLEQIFLSFYYTLAKFVEDALYYNQSNLLQKASIFFDSITTYVSRKHLGIPALTKSGMVCLENWFSSVLRPPKIVMNTSYGLSL